LTPANPQVAFTAPAPSTPQTAPPTDQVTTSARADMPQSKAETSAAGKSGSNELKAAQTPSQPAPAESGILLAENKAARKKEDSIRADKPSPAPASGARTLDSNASNLPSSVGETVNVSGEAVAVDTRDSATVLMARNEAPAVEKAKPAPPEIGAQQAPAEQIEATDQLKASAGQAAAGASSLAVNRAYAVKSKVLAKQVLAPSFTWAIRAGVLQRSADGGQTWQSSLHSDHPLLCYTSAGGSVWAGGQAGTLFHSADGVSWVQIQPAVKGQPLSADITNIDVRRPTDVVLSTGNNETWSTSDGGKTWEKK